MPNYNITSSPPAKFLTWQIIRPLVIWLQFETGRTLRKSDTSAWRTTSNEQQSHSMTATFLMCQLTSWGRVFPASSNADLTWLYFLLWQTDGAHVTREHEWLVQFNQRNVIVVQELVVFDLWVRDDRPHLSYLRLRFVSFKHGTSTESHPVLSC